MVRIFAFLAGLGFIAALLVGALMPRDAVVETASKMFHKHAKHVAFSSDGPMGKFDHAQLQRGYQVYKEVCSACHGLRHVSFYDLSGIGLTPGQIKTVAATYQVPFINQENGDQTSRRPGLSSDKFPSPYDNDVQAKIANNNVSPPDLSLMAKAREGGEDYIYSLLTGYEKVPANLPKDAQPGTGLHYNPYFAALNIGMPPPLTADGQVTYGEGAPKATVDQMSKDVSAFLLWAAEPKLEARKRAGLVTIGFLLVLLVLCWLSYKSIWAEKKH